MRHPVPLRPDADACRELSRARFRGLLLGTAVGDALGLPAEGLTRLRAARMFRKPWSHHFLLNRGMISDDTEHTLFVSQCLLAHPLSVDRFGRRLSWCLRGWFAALPAGVGLATAKACLRLLVGWDWRRSGGVSAGNGPAMRVAPLGAFFCDDPEAREAFVEVSTRMTHTDPRALTGARAIAATAAWIMRSRDRKPPPLDEFCALLSGLQPSDSEWRTWIERLENGLRNGVRVDEFAGQGRRPQGVSGYIYHTVPVVLFAWYRHFGDFEATLESVLDCGGDTDTTGAIAGALAGLTVGEDGIPRAWIAGVNDWPRGVPVLRQVADRLAAVHTGEPSPGPVSYPWAAIPLRNLVFLLVVLLHGFRRLFPPY